MSGLVAYAVIHSQNVMFQLHGLKISEPTRKQRLLSYTMRGLMLLMIPVASSVPSVSTFSDYR